MQPWLRGTLRPSIARETWCNSPRPFFRHRRRSSLKLRRGKMYLVNERRLFQRLIRSYMQKFD